MDNNTCLNIIAGFVIAVCYCGLLHCAIYFLAKACDLKTRRQEEEAELQYYRWKSKQEAEQRAREAAKEAYENARPRWEEHIEYFNDLNHQDCYHQQVSFKNWEEDEEKDL